MAASVGLSECKLVRVQAGWMLFLMCWRTNFSKHFIRMWVSATEQKLFRLCRFLMCRYDDDCLSCDSDIC